VVVVDVVPGPLTGQVVVVGVVLLVISEGLKVLVTVFGRLYQSVTLVGGMVVVVDFVVLGLMILEVAVVSPDIVSVPCGTPQCPAVVVGLGRGA